MSAIVRLALPDALGHQKYQISESQPVHGS